MDRPVISVVLGSLNRRKLLELTVDSIRHNGFQGPFEIIVVDGGSTDGTCDWLARQNDIMTFIQPNYRVRMPDGSLRRRHTWGEFMNLGFRAASADWILMVSDDLIVCPGAVQAGLSELEGLVRGGNRIGGGSFYWREYPRSTRYHVTLLPGGFVNINHGFFNKLALEAVGYADATEFEFYGADGDLSVRLNLCGWRTVALSDAFAEHLNHKIPLSRMLSQTVSSSTKRDMSHFFEKYSYLPDGKDPITREWSDVSHCARRFWKADPISCLQGYTLRHVVRDVR
jgi:glycosyltransferase involved in cell wall biosynthesis